jgi:hypothetical protein
MFIPLDESRATELRPADSKISPSDWAVLADFWHPVAFLSELGPQTI